MPSSKFMLVVALSLLFKGGVAFAEIPILDYSVSECASENIPEELCRKAIVELDNESLRTIAEIYISRGDKGLNYSRAVTSLYKATERHDSIAETRLAQFFVTPGYERIDESIRLLHLAARNGYDFAQYLLAISYFNGLGMLRSNYVIAVNWAKQSAIQNYVPAMVFLAYCYNKGLGVYKSFDKAEEWYQKAAEKGGESELYNLGWLYLTADDKHRDVKKAFEYFQRSAEQNWLPAINALAIMYGNGIGTDVNAEKATQYFEKAEKAEYALAFLNHGIYKFISMAKYDKYKQGRVARQLFEEAYDRNVYDAAAWIGETYFQEPDLTESLANKGIEWFRKGAENNSSLSMYKLGLIYEDGNYIDKNCYEAAEWIAKAAYQDFPEAELELAGLYEQGCGVVQDSEFALALKERGYSHKKYGDFPFKIEEPLPNNLDFAKNISNTPNKNEFNETSIMMSIENDIINHQ